MQPLFICDGPNSPPSWFIDGKKQVAAKAKAHFTELDAAITLNLMRHKQGSPCLNLPGDCTQIIINFLSSSITEDDVLAYRFRLFSLNNLKELAASEKDKTALVKFLFHQLLSIKYDIECCNNASQTYYGYAVSFQRPGVTN